MAEGVCIFTITAPEICTSTSYTRPEYAHPIVHEIVNTDSRPKIRVRDYRTATDILYIPKDAFQHFTSDVCGNYLEPWVADVRNLALALPVAGYGLWLPIALQRLDSLGTLCVVYPASSSTFDCHDDVPLPTKKNASLRILTDEERTALVVKADYLYETHSGDIPVIWSKNADAHLEMVEAGLIRNLDLRGWPGSSDKRLPLWWDKEAGRLALRYEAGVFETRLPKSVINGKVE